MAYGGSQARGQMGAAAAGLPHSSRQHRIFNPWSEVRAGTLILMDTSWVRYPLNHSGNPLTFLFKPRVSMLASWA